MATLHHNISGELTQELLAAADSVAPSYISIVNTHASITCAVDLYVEKKLTGKFYLAKAIALPVGVTLIFDKNGYPILASEFGLFIKLTKGASESPSVDVIIY
tara:strand:+ start:437 stop:745 length:309 start_codon:yes stop_codon:yes gene_type:complete